MSIGHASMPEKQPFTDVIQVLRQRFVDRKATLAVAESVTAGLIQSMIGNVSGASDYFVGGIVAYNLKQKVRQLGISPKHAMHVDCVSQRVAEEMARGVGKKFEASFAVATTGYAEAAGQVGVPAPLAYVAIWKDIDNGVGKVVRAEQWSRQLGRNESQRAIANHAIRMLLEVIEVAG